MKTEINNKETLKMLNIYRFNYWSFFLTTFVIDLWLLYVLIVNFQNNLFNLLANIDNFNRKRYLYQALRCYLQMILIFVIITLLTVIIQLQFIHYYHWKIVKYFQAYQFICQIGRIIQKILQFICIELF